MHSGRSTTATPSGAILSRMGREWLVSAPEPAAAREDVDQARDLLRRSPGCSGYRRHGTCRRTAASDARRAVEVDVLDDHHIVIIDGEERVKHLIDVRGVPARQKFVRLFDALGVSRSPRGRILAEIASSFLISSCISILYPARNGTGPTRLCRSRHAGNARTRRTCGHHASAMRATSRRRGSSRAPTTARRARAERSAAAFRARHRTRPQGVALQQPPEGHLDRRQHGRSPNRSVRRGLNTETGQGGARDGGAPGRRVSARLATARSAAGTSRCEDLRRQPGLAESTCGGRCTTIHRAPLAFLSGGDPLDEDAPRKERRAPEGARRAARPEWTPEDREFKEKARRARATKGGGKMARNSALAWRRRMASMNAAGRSAEREQNDRKGGGRGIRKRTRVKLGADVGRPTPGGSRQDVDRQGSRHSRDEQGQMLTRAPRQGMGAYGSRADHGTSRQERHSSHTAHQTRGAPADNGSAGFGRVNWGAGDDDDQDRRRQAFTSSSTQGERAASQRADQGDGGLARWGVGVLFVRRRAAWGEPFKVSRDHFGMDVGSIRAASRVLWRSGRRGRWRLLFTSIARGERERPGAAGYRGPEGSSTSAGGILGPAPFSSSRGAASNAPRPRAWQPARERTGITAMYSWCSSAASTRPPAGRPAAARRRLHRFDSGAQSPSDRRSHRCGVQQLAAYASTRKD